MENSGSVAVGGKLTGSMEVIRRPLGPARVGPVQSIAMN